MKLIINTPDYRSTFSIAWLEINTPTGNYVVQRGHVPTIMNLTTKQPLTFRLKSGKRESIMVHQGIISIDREQAIIVMNTLE